MEYIEKNFNYLNNGFTGSYKISTVTTEKIIFKQFLANHCDDTGVIYHTIKELIPQIIIIENLNIAQEFQNKGHGSYLLKEILKIYHIENAILACDVTENQRFGFVLENFYERHNFKTIETYQDFPLMLYPKSLAIKTMKKLIKK